MGHLKTMAKVTLYASLLVGYAASPFLVAGADEPEGDPVPFPITYAPLSWYPDDDGAGGTSPSGETDFTIANGTTSRWMLEASNVDAAFPAEPWSLALDVDRAFIGTLTAWLTIANETTGERAISGVLSLDGTACTPDACAADIPIPEPFLVYAGERVVLHVRYATLALDGTSPTEAPYEPTPARAKTNRGTVKVHDDEVAVPEVRNEPHVSCEFWIEGFGMEGNAGALQFEWWPPQGNKKIVMPTGATIHWRSDSGANAKAGQHHFLNGPYRLPAGHYRLEAYSYDGHPGSKGHFAKAKMFWVDPCVAPLPLRFHVGVPGTQLTSAHSMPPNPTPELGTLALVGLGLPVAYWGFRRARGKGSENGPPP